MWIEMEQSEGPVDPYICGQLIVHEGAEVSLGREKSQQAVLEPLAMLSEDRP